MERALKVFPAPDKGCGAALAVTSGSGAMTFTAMHPGDGALIDHG
jgi:hypothetical protein